MRVLLALLALCALTGVCVAQANVVDNNNNINNNNDNNNALVVAATTAPATVPAPPPPPPAATTTTPFTFNTDFTFSFDTNVDSFYESGMFGKPGFQPPGGVNGKTQNVWGVFGVEAKIGTNASLPKSQQYPEFVCSPVIYPGGYTMTVYVPPNVGNLYRSEANGQINVGVSRLANPGTKQFKEGIKGMQEWGGIFGLDTGLPINIPTNEGGAACVSYFGWRPLEFTYYVALGPSMGGIQNYAFYVAFVSIVFGGLLLRTYTTWDDKEVEPSYTIVTAFLKAPYFPGLSNLPTRYARLVELAAFTGGLMITNLPPAAGPYLHPAATAMESKQSPHLNPGFMPLPVYTTILTIPLAILFQLLFGVVAKLLAQTRHRIGHFGAHTLISLLTSVGVFFAILFMPSGYDYRMQALITRKFIVFVVQMAIWLGAVRPILAITGVCSSGAVGGSINAGNYETV